MEDHVFGIFDKEPKQIIYKQILTLDEIDDLHTNLKNNNINVNTTYGLASGHREHCDINIRDNYKFIGDRL
jgi:hypothetical protein